MAFESISGITGGISRAMAEAQATQAQRQSNQDAARDLWRKKRLASILSTYRTADGALDEVAAAAAAAESDLTPAFREAVYGAEKSEMGARADIAQNRMLLKQLGAPTDVGVYIPPKGGQVPVPVASIDETGFSTPSMAAQPVARPAAEGEVNISASLPEMPQPEYMTQLPEPRGNIAASLDYEPQSIGESMTSVSGGGLFSAPGSDAELEWTPQDDENAFRKYGKTLSGEAKASGIEPREMLRRIRDDAAAKVLKPAPNAALISMGKEGIAKYTQQVAERALSEEQARAAGSKAVADYRAGLVGKAKDFGGVSHEEEKFEADMGGRRAGMTQPGVMRFRAVSTAEKERGDKLSEVYQDLYAGFKRGTFEGDYGAAIAKAKQDGSVNADAVTANLVAMGAWPSTRALALKNILSDSPGAIAGDGYKFIKQKIGEPNAADQTARAAWYKDAIENINNALYSVGLRAGGSTAKAKSGGGLTPKEMIEKKRKEHAEAVRKKEAAKQPPAAKAPRQTNDLKEFD